MIKKISADLPKLKDLIANKGFRAISISVTFTPVADSPSETVTPHSVVTVTNGSDTIELESDDLQFSMYALSLKKIRDQVGTTMYRPFANLDKYWTEMESLVKDQDTKRKAALQRLTSNTFRFDYSPKTLVTRFLASRKWGAAEFAALKRDHFEIQAYILLHGKQMLSTQQSLHRNKPGSEQYGDTIDEVLRKAFRTDVDFVTNYLKFQEALASDTEDTLTQALAQHKIVKDTLDMLGRRGTVPGEVGIPHLLDIYRRLSESLVPLINVLSEAVCVLESRQRPDPRLGFAKRCEIIKRSSYGGLLVCLDPAIRNSESHAATQVDKATGKVYLTEIINGQRRIIGTYTFEQVAEMTRELLDVLFPSLLFSFYMHELALILVILFSPEYIELLLCIDNMQQV